MTVEPIAHDQRHPNETFSHDFRVAFWRQHDPPDDAENFQPWWEEVWDLRADDVHEVIEWADHKAGNDASYTLFVRLGNGQAEGDDLLIQLAGVTPVRNPPLSDGFHIRRP